MKSFSFLSRPSSDTRLQLTVRERLGRLRRPFAVFLAVLVGLFLLTQKTDIDHEVEPVVVAARDMPLGTVLSAEDLKVIELPVNADAGLQQLFADPAALVGQQIAVPLSQGVPLIANQFVGQDLLKSLAPGLQAVTVRPADHASARIITPGTMVDLISPSTVEFGQQEAEQVFREVLVLFNSSFDSSESAKEQPILGAAAPPLEPVLLVAVPDNQAQELASASASHRLVVTLTARDHEK